MKKIMLLISIIFFLTGCSATYNIKITDDTFKETLQIDNFDKNSWDSAYQNTLNVSLQANIPVIFSNYAPERNNIIDTYDYYKITKIETDNSLGLKYSYTFSLADYNNSTIVLNYFPKFRVSKKNYILSLNSGKSTEIFKKNPSLDDITIKMSTNYKVSEHNADDVTNNMYSWVLTKNNYQEKTIKITINTEEEIDLFKTNSEGYFGSNTLILLYIAIGVIVLMFLGYILLKIRKSDD